MQVVGRMQIGVVEEDVLPILENLVDKILENICELLL